MGLGGAAQTEAYRLAAKVHIDCTSRRFDGRELAGAVMSERRPVCRTCLCHRPIVGLSEDDIEIHDLDKLPSESSEVVVALQGVEVPGRRSLGPVTLRAG